MWRKDLLRDIRKDRYPHWLKPAPTYRYIDVPVLNGIATLPDGRTVRSQSQVVRVPVMEGV